MNETTAIILGGGRGERLFPLTLERAKPAVGFAGKYRLIDIPISNCINSNVKRVFVLTQFMSASLHRHIMQAYQFDTFSNGFIDIVAAEQTPGESEWFQGTADAVRATLKHTTYFRSDNTLILSGDHLYKMDYSKLIKYHTEKNADITLCANPVSFNEASRMGLIKSNRDGRVSDFVEKSSNPSVIQNFKVPEDVFSSHNLSVDTDQYLASMGVYIFKTDVLIKLLEDEKKVDFGKEIIGAAVKTKKVFVYPFANYWMDIGTIGAFFTAHMQLTKRKPPFSLYNSGWPIYTHSRSLPPSRAMGSKVKDSLLVDGCVVTNAEIIRSVIGSRSIIQDGTKLNKVLMMGADFYKGEHILKFWKDGAKNSPPLGIGKNCNISRTIIDKNARIGNNVIIGSKKGHKDYRGEKFWIRDGITIIKKGVVIPSGTVI